MASQKKSLVLVLPLFRAGGGSERVVLTLLRHLDREKFHLHLITFDEGGSLKPLLPPDVATTHLGTFGPKQSFWPLFKTLRRIRPDMLVDFLWHTTVLVMAARTLGRMKFRHVERVAFARPPGTPAQDWMSDVEKSETFNHKTYPRLDQLVAQSEAMKNNLLGVYALKPEQVRVIPNPVDLKLVRELAAQGENPFRDPGPQVLYVGRLSRVKDIPLLLKAFAVFHAAHGGTLTLVGEGEDEAPLRVLAAPLGEAVVFGGGVENPFCYMAHADLLALTSRYDSFPNVLIEAHALSLPCVSTDCPDGPRAILVPQKTGLLTPPGDEAAFAAALSQAWEMKQSGAFDPAAFEEVAARHDVAQVVRDWEEMLLFR